MKKSILQLRQKGRTYKEIAQIVGCSLSNVRYYCTIDSEKGNLGNNKHPTTEDIKNFQVLYDKLGSVAKVATKVTWCRKTIGKYVTVKKRSVKESKEHRSQRIIKYRRERKLKLVEYKGGSCIKCGYHKCVRALDFHHRNSEEKKFVVSANFTNYSLEELKVEVDKCDLICANCHREIHYYQDLKKVH